MPDETWARLEELLAYALGREKEKVYAALRKRFHSFSAIYNAPEEELLAIPGMTVSAVLLLRLSRNLGTKICRERLNNGNAITSSGDILRFLRSSLGAEDREFFFLISLDAENFILSGDMIAAGTIDKVYINTRDLFEHAFRCDAVKLILVHNHPGGCPTPSTEDWDFTESLQQTGRSLNIEVMDHIIVTHNGIYSMAAACTITLKEESLFRFGQRRLIVPHSGIPFNASKISSLRPPGTMARLLRLREENKKGE